MKKIIIALCFLVVSCYCFAQTCEEKTEKILYTTGSVSAAMLYNTYGLIGSISDGFVHDAYDLKTANNLLDAQNKLMDNLVKAFDDLTSGNYLSVKSDMDYAIAIIAILKGLKNQSQLVQEYMKNAGKPAQEAYEAQRAKNWKDISKLMGIEE